MRNKIFLLMTGVILALISVVFYACQKYSNDYKLSRSAVFSVREAKKYFRSSSLFENTSLTKVNGIAKGVGEIIPWWGLAVGFKNNGVEYVEVPSRFSNKHMSSVKRTRRGTVVDATSGASSFERLLFYRDKKGKINQRVVTYMPDAGYLEKNNFDASKNYLSNIGKDYNGYILYSTIEHEPIYMLKIKQGKGIKRYQLTTRNGMVNQGTIATNSPNNSTALHGEPECWEDCFEQWQQTCVIKSDPAPGEREEECFDPIFLGEVCIVTCAENPDPPPVGEDPCLDPANAEGPSCNPGGGDGNGENNNDQCVNDFQNNPTQLSDDAQVVFEPVSEATSVINRITKNKNPRWVCLKSATWSLFAQEKGTVKLVNVRTNKWQWETLTHENITFIGSAFGGTVSSTNGIGTPSFTPGTQNVLYAGMSLSFDVTYAPICDCPGINLVLPPYTIPYTANAIWDAIPRN